MADSSTSPRHPSEPRPLDERSPEEAARESLQTSLESLRQSLGIERVSITLTTEDAYGVHLQVLAETGTGLPADEPTIEGAPGHYFQPGVSPCLETLVCQNIADEPLGRSLEGALLAQGIRSYTTLPLVSQGHPVGTLNLGSRRAGCFDASLLERARQACPLLAEAAWHVFLFRWHATQTRFLEISRELIQAVGPHVGIRETCDRLSRQLAERFEVDRVTIYLVSEDRGWLTNEALYDRGESDGGKPHLQPSLSLEKPSVLSDILAGKPLTVVHPARHLELPEALRQRFDPERWQSILAIPLLQGEAPVGIAVCQRVDPTPILAADAISSLPLLGQQIGLMLHSRWLVEHQERSAYNFAELLNMSHVVSSTADLTQVPELVARQARDLCEADESTLCLLESDGITLRPVVCLGEWAEQVLEARIRVGQGITGTVAARRRGEVINRAELDPRSMQIPGTPLEPEAICSVPLICADRLVGVLTLHKLEGRTFNPVDLDALEIFGSQAAVAIDNARLIAGIHEERTRLVTMLQQMEEGVVFVDKDGLVLLINNAARRMLNLDGDDQSARPVMDVLEGPDFAVLRTALNRVQSRDDRNVTEEYTVRGRAYLVSVSAVHGGEGLDRSGEVLFLKDVTDLKEIEAQLLQSNKMSAVGQLAAGVAHEFNNLIASIYGYAQFMQEHQDPKVIQKGVDIILRSSERARELTSSLLTFSRRRPGRREPVDVNQILTDTLLLLHRQLEKSRIHVERETGRIPLTVADPGKLQQVVLSVLINAQQAMEQGGKLRVVSRVQGGTIEIVVQDEGIGITAEDLPRIFEPFFTTKGPLSGAKTPGVGLGLSSAYNIIRDHGGSINATSRPEEGTTMTIRVPVRSLKEPEQEPTGPRPPRSLEQTGRVLLVDESPALSDLIAEILGATGHQVARAEDGEGALRSAAEGECDVVILDHTAPASEAVGVYRKLRDRHAELPVVFITTRARSQVVEAEGDPWMFRINKPFRNRDLVSLVARVLTQSLRRAS